MAFNRILARREIAEAMLGHPAVQYGLSPFLVKLARKLGVLYICWFGYPFDIPSRILARKMMKILKGGQTGVILDVGCSHGAFDFELARRGYHVVGIDLNQDSLAVGNRIKKILKFENIFFLQMDILKGRLDKGTFDAVLMFETLEHIKDDLIALREVHRLLKKEGLLLLSVPYAEKPEEYDHPIGACQARDGSCHTIGEGGSHFRNGYRLEQLYDLMEKGGFEVIQGEYLSLPRWLHASPLTFPIKYPLSFIGQSISRNHVKAFVLAKKPDHHRR